MLLYEQCSRVCMLLDIFVNCQSSLNCIKMDTEWGIQLSTLVVSIITYEKPPMYKDQCGNFEKQMKITRLDLKIVVIHS